MSNNHNKKITVIIPTLNEAKNIGSLIQHLQKFGNDDLAEIIVCDASSEDDTAIIAKEYGAKTLSIKTASRAQQMNTGAKIAQGNILYFVHADTKPPKSFAKDIINIIAKGHDCVGYRC